MRERELMKRPAMTKFLLALLVAGSATPSFAKSITYIGVTKDVTNFSPTGADFGQSGYWFPQFAAASPVSGRPTDENDRDALPAWAGPLNHVTNPADPAYSTRSFSQDNGGVRSKGGETSWNTFTLPSGEAGLSGSLVDPQTANNSNNTINRIQLNNGIPGDALPSSFLLRIIADNTAGQHNPVGRIRPRGEGPTQPDVGVQLSGASLAFNGVADVYTFRYDGWESGDFIKLQLNSGTPGQAAGIAGILFDAVPVPEPTTYALAAVAGAACIAQARRRRIQR